MPKEAKTTRKTKAKAETGGKKKKGMMLRALTSLPFHPANHCHRPQCAQAWFFRYALLGPLPPPPSLIRIAGQVGKVLGEKWKALNAKQREPYEAKAKADKERYEADKAAYNNNAGDDDEEEE
ncbi:MAG: hypothetical protein L6R40_003869 [Gallowayella cf. fulva]|nr:MAG: hypothetical protein L6R40_003869 [Xanthomendoza cf. fulva]